MIAATFFASGAIFLPANLSAAPASGPPPLEECDESPVGLPAVERHNLDKYSGYYKLNDREFWHIMSSMGRLYVVANDSSVRPINQNKKYDFCLGKENVPNLFFKFSADGVPESIRFHIDSSEGYAEDDKGMRSQAQVFPAKDVILPRIEKEAADSIYENVRSIRQDLMKSRAPRPANLSVEAEKKIRAYIYNQIDNGDKDDPYTLVAGHVESIEYLGVSPQGEQVLRVARERSVMYWRILLDPKGQVIRSSASLSL
jgi:hypothetical protein